LEIESEEDLIVSNGQVVAVVEQVKLTAIEEKITSNSFGEVLTVEKNINLSWKGKSISTMQHLNSINSADLPKIIPARNQHAVLFQVSSYYYLFHSCMIFISKFMSFRFLYILAILCCSHILQNTMINGMLNMSKCLVHLTIYIQ
jgi:hypothetical protein